MILIQCSNLSLSFGADVILKNINIAIHDNEKVGIVGVNGAGKSTLLKLLTGELIPDDGDIQIARGINIGYLRQDNGLDSDRSLWEEVLTVYAPLMEIERRMRELERQISLEKDEDRLLSYNREYARLGEQFELSGGYEYVSRARGILRGLGFKDEEFNRKVQTLSGGQKTRLALAKLLNENPDVLMLDEPTNHLDLQSVEWLETFLKNYKKAVLVISHDRYFLDNITDRILEIEYGTVSSYNGNYTAFVKQKETNREIQLKHYENQQKEIKRLEEFIEKQRQWNRERNIIAAESRQKAIERMEKVEKPPAPPQKVRMQFVQRIQSGNEVLKVSGLSAGYPGKTLFKNISFQLRRGEKVFLIGPNGCGKSTLLKILTGEKEPDEGEYRFGYKVNAGYYDQELSGLDERNTILDEVWDENTDRTAIRNTLAAFQFTGEDIFKPVSVLSGGEKSRVCLVKLMLGGYNLLFLDEPTNHLDIPTREVLEQALLQFEGTILAVSHDRYFINKLATRILAMENGEINSYPGNYEDYIRQRSLRGSSERDSSGNPISNAEEKYSPAKEQYQKAKEEKSLLARLTRQRENIEASIHQKEARLNEIDIEMNKEENATDYLLLSALQNEKEELEQALDDAYEQWCRIVEQLGQ